MIGEALAWLRMAVRVWRTASKRSQTNQMREGSNARIKKMVGIFMDFYSFGMLMSSRSTEKPTFLNAQMGHGRSHL